MRSLVIKATEVAPHFRIRHETLSLAGKGPNVSRVLVVLLRKWTVWPCYDVSLSRVTVGAPGGRALTLYVVVYCELVRVRAETQRVVFFLFHVDPVGDEIFVEDVTAQQEGVIGLERFNCTAK
jgi:hypothetical protein